MTAGGDTSTDTSSPDGHGDGALSNLIGDVEQEHGGEGAAAMADHLRDRLDETNAQPEEPGDVED